MIYLWITSTIPAFHSLFHYSSNPYATACTMKLVFMFSSHCKSESLTSSSSTALFRSFTLTCHGHSESFPSRFWKTYCFQPFWYFTSPSCIPHCPTQNESTKYCVVSDYKLSPLCWYFILPNSTHSIISSTFRCSIALRFAKSIICSFLEQVGSH